MRTVFLEGELDETAFVRRLINETKPCTILTQLASQYVSVERTPENTIEITRGSVLSSVVPVRLKAVLKIDGKGRLDVKGIAWSEDFESGRKPEIIKGDTIFTDVVGIYGSKQEWANQYAYALMGIEIDDSEEEFFPAD